MEIYVGLKGEKKGPLSLYRVRQMLEQGEITPETLGWIRGEESWKPLSQIPVIAELIEEIERERLDRELEKLPRPQVAPEPTPAQRMPSHSFARFAARMFDIMLLQLILLAVLGVPEGAFQRPFWEFSSLSETDMNSLRQLTLIHVASILGSHVLEVFFLTFFGTTPGKHLFKLQVRMGDGRKMPLHFSMARSVLVWTMGMGFGIDLLQWIANFLAYLRVQRRGIAAWDSLLGTQVQQHPVTRERMLVVLVVFMALVLSHTLL